MWEAFLLQMNDFDRFLELELKAMLDSVVASRPPARRGRKQTARLVLLPFAADALVAEAIPVVEPAVVNLPVARARSL